jgi:hypothetical protein
MARNKKGLGGSVYLTYAERELLLELLEIRSVSNNDDIAYMQALQEYEKNEDRATERAGEIDQRHKQNGMIRHLEDKILR